METVHIAEGQAFNVISSRLPNWSGWLATLVVDADGNHVGADGTSKTVSNAIDLQLLLALRSKCSVIVTTGATARAERYKSSRFAPIAFLTKNRESLSEVPAIKSAGEYPNIYLEQGSADLDFHRIGDELRALGHETFLFEGGAATLHELLDSKDSVQLVLSIVNGENTEDSIVEENQAKKLLNRVLRNAYYLELADDFIVGRNRITRWVKPSS